MITLENNPILDVIDICNRLYPNTQCEMGFVLGVKEQADAWAVTEWGTGEHPPNVSIDVLAPYSAVVELIAHEFAHAVAGRDMGHGDEWEAVFDAINKEFNK